MRSNNYLIQKEPKTDDKLVCISNNDKTIQNRDWNIKIFDYCTFGNTYWVYTSPRNASFIQTLCIKQ